ncbi:trifunctional protein with glutamine amidotransferase [Salpingoeca rosetta]|uniref:Trifunctional protein with glutamine amidotransferase n=1 Tax=Salpingoeca rosetta (strain ATCC 50818 / BSB-021) TaxID=946362 RepID=F2UBX6_SALR5|nr:trifunctional protein with glutamine amidotransferase [Salpingoeca rosetta]EGD74391.1 trifunctional protein with glutamine amidotransferase [Salpingoeca rosetta]|eukprot:XP_004993291.1 trifunctional protein with glutamine amidotransferase [Salpingoeca rosetta]
MSRNDDDEARTGGRAALGDGDGGGPSPWVVALHVQVAAAGAGDSAVSWGADALFAAVFAACAPRGGVKVTTCATSQCPLAMQLLRQLGMELNLSAQQCRDALHLHNFALESDARGPDAATGDQPAQKRSKTGDQEQHSGTTNNNNNCSSDNSNSSSSGGMQGLSAQGNTPRHRFFALATPDQLASTVRSLDKEAAEGGAVQRALLGIPSPATPATSAQEQQHVHLFEWSSKGATDPKGTHTALHTETAPSAAVPAGIDVPPGLAFVGSLPLGHAPSTGVDARVAVSNLRHVLTARNTKAATAWNTIARALEALACGAPIRLHLAAPTAAVLGHVETQLDKLVAYTRRFSVTGKTTASTGGKKQDILAVISQQRLRDVATSKEEVSLEEMKRRAASQPPPIDFAARLRACQPMAVMAEVKRASPSRGDIAPDMKADEQARRYARGGAAAISVLTEPTWFKGTLDDLRAARNVFHDDGDRPAFLRKDFLLDEYQVYEARAYGADTCLLIVAILSDAQLSSLMATCRSLGMEPLVEVATPGEMARAVAAGAAVIGINNRNLKDFSVDTNTTATVISSVQGGLRASTIVCALSGINTRLDVQRYRAAGCKAVLVGESLMRAPDPAVKIAQLRGLEPALAPPPTPASTTAVPSTTPLGVLVKICGVKTPAMAMHAITCGADMVGLVFAEGSTRKVTVEQASAIAAAVRKLADLPPALTPGIRSRVRAADEDVFANYARAASRLRMLAAYRPLVVGVFANQDAAAVADIARAVPLDVIQLSGTEGIDAARAFDSTSIVIKATHIAPTTTAADVAQHVRAVEPGVQPDAILLDTKSKGALGGTGIAFDHALAASLVREHGLPLMLAGGLTVDNIGEKVAAVRPFAVDVSSGVETDGRKDRDKIETFIRAAKLA